MITARRSTLVLAVASLVAAGCGGGGGSDVTPKARIAACLDKQPDATQSDCEGWEKDGKLGDDGAHVDHKKMNG